MTVLSLTADQLPGNADRDLGYSGWHEITQRRVDLFAEATGDHQWIHVDPARAADGPFGGPIAHGFMILSLLPLLTSEVFEVHGRTHAINYRTDRVRFRAPVAVGARVRAAVRLVSVRPRPRGFLEVVVAVSIEIEDGRVACSAEQTTLYPGAE